MRSIVRVIMAIRENAQLSLTLVVIVPLMALVIGTLVAISIPLFRQMQGRVDKITEVLREQIMGIRVVRAFIRTTSEQRRFDRANTDLTDTALRVNRIFALAVPSPLRIMNISTLRALAVPSLRGIMNPPTVAVLWFGGPLVDSGDMPIGNLTAFLMYIFQILF